MDIFDHSNNSAVDTVPGSTMTAQLEIAAAEHLLALLQREANDYSLPLPVHYYPNQFDDSNVQDDDETMGNKNSSSTVGPSPEKDLKSNSKTPIIGPWRKRIASWMYDVVDHFKYERNVVSVALRYIDQYVSHLMLRAPSKKSSPMVKRRHFQLIAVTSLYLAIKIHGELIEEDDEEKDIISSLLSEVDGYGMKGIPSNHVNSIDDDGDDDGESDDEIRALSNKIAELRRRQRLGRLRQHLHDNKSQQQHQAQSALHPIPFKPRKRGMLSGPLRLSSFVELSRGLFTSQDITDTESKILKALNYVVNPPTSRRFVGEMIRILALCTSTTSEARRPMIGVTAAEVELDRREILQAILASACHQTETAVSVPALSIGCIPSIVAYAALLNAIDEEFDKHTSKRGRDTLSEQSASSMMMVMESEKRLDSYQLEDFQRHYRRYARSQSAPIKYHGSTSSCNGNNREWGKERYLEAWKEQFLLAVFHATNCFLTPDSTDVLRVRELLLAEVKPESSPQDETDASSQTENARGETSNELSPTNNKKARQPRSPRSVIVGMASARFRGSGSFFSSRTSSGTNVLCSPFDASRASFGSSCKGGETPSFRSSSSSMASTFSSVCVDKAYYKLVSDPVTSEGPHHHINHSRAGSLMNTPFLARASTPDVSHCWKNDITTTEEDHWKIGQGMNQDCWRSEAFQPPPFFSA